MTVALSLAEQGWIEIDSATVRIRGDVQQVISEMQDTLERPEVICLCDRLGVYSAGVMFFDRFTRMTRFFRTDDAPQPTYATRYISPTKSISAAEFEGLHNLFLIIREQQAGWAKGDELNRALAPEYFRYLPSTVDGQCALVPEEEGFRARYAVHYCTVGEMIVTAYLWRMLSRLQQAGSGDAPLDADLDGILDRTSLAPRLLWCGSDMLERLAELPSSAALLDRWRDEVGPVDRWNDDWPSLGLAGPHAALNIAAALRFCSAVDGVATPDAAADPRLFNRRILSIVGPLLKRLDPGCAAATVDEAVASLERLARFPILPFFVWNALETEPHVYCIVPVWTSQAHDFEGNYHLGFALTALKPNLELDWSLRDCGVDPKDVAADVDPLIITSLLRLVARPLVEHSLYGNLVRLANEDGHNAFVNQVQDELDLIAKQPPRPRTRRGRRRLKGRSK